MSNFFSQFKNEETNPQENESFFSQFKSENPSQPEQIVEQKQEFPKEDLLQTANRYLGQAIGAGATALA